MTSTQSYKRQSIQVSWETNWSSYSGFRFVLQLRRWQFFLFINLSSTLQASAELIWHTSCSVEPQLLKISLREKEKEDVPAKFGKPKNFKISHFTNLAGHSITMKRKCRTLSLWQGNCKSPFFTMKCNFIIVIITLFYVHCRTKASLSDQKFTLSCTCRFHSIAENISISSLHLTRCGPQLHLSSVGNCSVALTDHWLSVLHITWPPQVHFFCLMPTRISTTPS